MIDPDFFDYAIQISSLIFDDAIQGINDIIQHSRLKRQEKGILLYIKVLFSIIKANSTVLLKNQKSLNEIYDHLILLMINAQRREEDKVRIEELQNEVEELKKKAKEEWQPYIDALKEAIGRVRRWRDDNR